MGLDRAGWPFILGALCLAGVAAWWVGRLGALPFVVLAGFFAFFFRDPDRTAPSGPHLVVAPADGRVMIAGDPPFSGIPAGEWQLVSIFLSPLDVHVNRTPVAGRVTRITRHPGRFLPAYRTEAGTSNEWTEIWFDHHGTPVVCRQIVGVLARRIVTRLKTGQEVELGERMGVMKFGSRIDLFVPREASVVVSAGDRVVAGESIVAHLPATEP
jgi:phosphatidylserine decarboxylase